MYHFFQLPPEANLGELDAVGARWCGTDWQEVDRTRGRETQACTDVDESLMAHVAVLDLFHIVGSCTLLMLCCW